MSPIDRPATGQENGLKPDRARPGEAARRSTTRGDVPPSLLDRYLIERDSRGRPAAFFRDHRSTDPAFRDHGRRLSTPHAYPDTVSDMLKVAQHRGWSRLRVEGSEAFRRDVWIQAQALGLEVAGYRPRERDRQAANRGTRSPNTIDRIDPNTRLKMAETVVKSRVADPDIRQRLLVRAANLVTPHRERPPSSPLRSWPEDRDRR